MRLRALEIQGFKSFADKTRLEFPKPVTCIVGPNGSGKSNISDAIMWVTGEQSTKALRGGKMEDIIFGGTAFRGKMGYAEVSLILDNLDGGLNIDSTEVMITRRYYRSGDSEYYINKSLCRLRDINELLMDTGMGHEGYSIIGQGKIDEILSVKSTDRRVIFEEAAGISRFRHRKEESERKLERTEENLLRVNDKIAELDLQREPLKKQAETAKKYLSLREELKVVEISLWSDRLTRLKENTDVIQSNIVDAENMLQEANDVLNGLYQGIEQLTEKTRGKDIEAENVRLSISELNKKLSDTESDLAVLSTKLDSNHEELERAINNIKRNEEQSSGIEQQISEKQQNIEEIKAQLALLAQENENLLHETETLDSDTGDSEKQFNVLVSEELQLNERKNQIREEISALSSAMQEREDRLNALTQQIITAKQRSDELKEKLTQVNNDISTNTEELTGIQNMLNGYDLKLNNLNKKLQSVLDAKRTAENDLNNIKSRISLLEEMEKEYQGYSKAVKFIMQEGKRGTLNGICGTVGELVKTDKKYSVSIETALGAAMQNIIVNTDQNAKDAIYLLKRKDVGRATFLPIGTIQSKRLNENGIEDEIGFEGIASELCQYDGKYIAIYENLLARTVIAETLDDAVRIGKKYRNRFKIVTLDGQVVNAGGSLTGGSASKNAGILSRSNELEGLKAELPKKSEALNTIEKQCAVLEENTADLRHLRNVTSDKHAETRLQLAKLNTELQHLEDGITESQRAEDDAKNASAIMRDKISEDEKSLKAFSDNIRELETKINANLTEQNRISEGREALLEKRNQLTEQIVNLKERTASFNAMLEAEEKSTVELSAYLNSIVSGTGEQEIYIDRLNLRTSELLNDIDIRRDEVQKYKVKIESENAKLSVVLEQKMQLEREGTGFNKQLQDKNQDILNLEREKGSLESKLQAALSEENQIVEKLWDSYELTRTQAKEAAKPLSEIDDAQKTASELKRQMSRLGTPNLGAIAEFERVNERYTYLTEQRDDISGAKEQLLKIIGDITDEMEKIFRNEFSKINTQFKITFTELFGGGKAELKLEDENDILNCGIEIKVQPPGKSLKTISLLSGGEKAFVAIAIYFAILKVRPAPFVILDEIESALDEANVVRFAEYMRRMSDNTQMLLISHRRGTMEQADILYGVTMQEQGVSNVMNVDLESAKVSVSTTI